MTLNQIKAIFGGSFFKSAAIYFYEKTFCEILFHCYQYPLRLIEIVIYKQIGVIGLEKTKKNHSQIFPAKFLAKNITLFWLSAIGIHDLLKDLQK